jgi:hypothetical protein
MITNWQQVELMGTFSRDLGGSPAKDIYYIVYHTR